jgi:archaellum component FlaC
MQLDLENDLAEVKKELVEVKKELAEAKNELAEAKAAVPKNDENIEICKNRRNTLESYLDSLQKKEILLLNKG